MRGRKMSRRRTRMRSSKSRIKFHRLMGLLIILLSFGGGWLVLDYQTFKTSPLPVAAEGYRHIIEPGTSVTRLAADLRQAGILPHPFYFRWMARWEGRAAMIKAGEYQFAAGITPTELLDQVVSGAVRGGGRGGARRRAGAGGGGAARGGAPGGGAAPAPGAARAGGPAAPGG